MKHPEHICRFNDAPQSCDCYDAGYEEGLKKAVETYGKCLEGLPCDDPMMYGVTRFITSDVVERLEKTGKELLKLKGE